MFSEWMVRLLLCKSAVLTVWSMKTCMHAKSLQSCLTLLGPMDCSLPGSSVHGILQARILEWIAICFSTMKTWGFPKSFQGPWDQSFFHKDTRTWFAFLPCCICSATPTVSFIAIHKQKTKKKKKPVSTKNALI